MNTFPIEKQQVLATSVQVTDLELIVNLSDGRTITVPLAWYPRLDHGTEEERSEWQFIGKGIGIHWPSLDEDIEVEHLLSGIPSGESQESLRLWLSRRGTGR